MRWRNKWTPMMFAAVLGCDAAIAQVELRPEPCSREASLRSTSVTVTIGGLSARVLFAGLTPGFTGLYHVNIIVPEGAPSGDAVPVVVTASGQTSPPATIAVRGRM